MGNAKPNDGFVFVQTILSEKDIALSEKDNVITANQAEQAEKDSIVVKNDAV